eukprot:TRINITY_DN800_c0_g1_i1.p1 TRINITY_DN800_c0_g1~~TRINITY_DN800_c0_g1_i1.p1  ORF type:complete len:258 (+),score=65.96 TRINITY_DN800_c0_g1_i1:66-839(+)
MQRSLNYLLNNKHMFIKNAQNIMSFSFNYSTKGIKELINGHKIFKQNIYDKSKYEKLYEDQNPKIFYISCSDSRLVPNIITNSLPEDLFMLRTIGNYVSPKSNSESYDATVSALEFALNGLTSITDIIVCGHSKCGACKAIRNNLKDDDSGKLKHVVKFVADNENTRNEANALLEDEDSVKHFLNRNTVDVNDENTIDEVIEKISVVNQLKNIKTYEFVDEKLSSNTLKMHGWYFDIKSGNIEAYDSIKKQFRSIHD